MSMINPNMHMRDDIFTSGESAPTRDGFGRGIVEAAQNDPRIVVLTADLAESTRAEWFQKEFPERFIEMGVSEQNMAAVAAGLAALGKKPFITSYAMFNPGRNWEIIRTTAALNDLPVVICGMHAGVSVGPDGATHQALEDIALMRTIPNMTVISPCDVEEARKATLWAAQAEHPVYLRFGREKTPMMTTPETPFEAGKVWTAYRTQSTVDSTKKVAILATGPLLYEVLKAAKELEGQGIAVAVASVHTIKPLDEAIIGFAREYGAIVTVEEHQTAGGMGSAIAELLAQHYPVPIEFIGVRDRFGQSGTMGELYREYHLLAEDIQTAAHRVIERAGTK